MPCDLGPIVEIARRHGLPVVEDAACAVGSEILWHGQWERIGRPHGDIACFSFHPRKVITTGDGGMLTTAQSRVGSPVPAVAAALDDGAGHGAARVASAVVFEEYRELGFNYRMTDLQAAIGREQLQPAARHGGRAPAAGAIATTSSWPALAGLQVPVEPAWARSNWQSYCVRLPDGRDQRAVMQAMLERGASRRGAASCARIANPPTVRSRGVCGASGVVDGSDQCSSLTGSEAITAHGLILPLFVGMTDDDQGRVVAALASALDEHSESLCR